MQSGFLADVVFYLSPRLSVEEGEQIREAITTAGGEILHTVYFLPFINYSLSGTISAHARKDAYFVVPSFSSLVTNI